MVCTSQTLSFCFGILQRHAILLCFCQVNNCVIDWLTPWPEEALLSVCTVFLADMDIQEDLRPLILDHIVMVHMSVCKLSIKFTQQTQRTNYVTPKNFLDYILTYRTSLKTKRIQNSEQAKRLDGGLQKLIQAKVEVSALQVILFIFIFLYLFGC
jgi:dynein heavy chain